MIAGEHKWYCLGDGRFVLMLNFIKCVDAAKTYFMFADAGYTCTCNINHTTRSYVTIMLRTRK
jgi:hypothetical protein